MPFVEANGVRTRYSWDGPANAPVVAFSNGLGTNLHMWDEQSFALQQRFRILRYDTRGHGDSGVTEGPYSIEQLATDFLSLLDALKIETCQFCGLSMGGMIGLWLAANHPKRFEKVVLANTAAKIGTSEMWNQRIAMVFDEGMPAVANGLLARWFTPGFQRSEPGKVAKIRRAFELTNPLGYTACCAAIRDMDQRSTVASIKVPTMIISGEYDPVTPPSESDALASAIAGAMHVKLPAAHLSNVERSTEFSNVLSSFLEDRNDR